MARRPGKGEEDPEEAALVEQFKANMGDYKLKTAGDYVVPKHQRVTFSKKRQSLLLLRNQVLCGSFWCQNLYFTSDVLWMYTAYYYLSDF